MSGTVEGELPAVVTFSSPERLIAIGDGQAGLTGADGVLTNLTVAMAGGVTFRSLAFNPLVYEGALGGAATIVVAGTASGLSTFNLNLGGNGSNHVTVTSVNEDISSVRLFVPGGFSDVRQPRIETLTAAGSAVPEPTTAALIGLGLGAVTLGRIGRRSHRSHPCS